MALSFPVLFEDVHLIVLCKPAGLLSQGEHTGDENLVDLLRAHFGRHYVGLVHRLDRNTSGILVVAKRSKSAERLTRALQSGALERSYLGWLEGDLQPDSGEGSLSWSDWLLRDEERNVTRVATARDRGARQALMQARPIASSTLEGKPITLCEFTLETGRAHQIRAQAASRGHPLLGDRKYGARIPFSRTALHSHRIRFPHPMSGETLEFECPLPADLPQPSKTNPLR